LLVRWLQLGLLSPLFRNHSAIHTRRQELWEFDPQTLATSRNIIRLRYALLPWLYSSFLQYAGMNTPLIRPLFWDFEDSRCLQIEDQFLYGDSIMAAPVYKANARGRYVYLPQLKWLCWQARSWEDRNPLVLSPGDHFLDCPLDRQLIFLRQNTLIAFQEPEDFVGQRQPDTLIITGMVTSQAELKLLEDQGKFPAFSGMSVLEINVSKLEYEYDITISCIKKAALHWQYLVFELYDAEGRLSIIHKRI
jgi:alpha-glucosidase